MRIILHIDMNSYFASVEQQANPHLRGLPVGVCEHLGGIIIAPSVEAKRLGIKLGTTVWDALKICPQMVLLPTDPEKYRSVTRQWMRILHDYAGTEVDPVRNHARVGAPGGPLGRAISNGVEKYSIDEAFIDLTTSCRGNYDDALLLALEIKQRLKLEVGEWVSASIGIGPNKLIAKIAADLPRFKISRLEAATVVPAAGRILNGVKMADCMIDNLGIVRPDEIEQLYSILNLTDVPGIAKNLERALNKLGIFSLLELAYYPLSNLLNQFGIWGYVLHDLGNLNSPRFASPSLIKEGVRGSSGRAKSFGHAYTVVKPLSDQYRIKKLMFKLAEKVGRRMRRHQARGNVIHYFHSDKQGRGFSKQRKIGEFINDGKDIFKVAWGIFYSDLSPSPSPGLGRVAARPPACLPTRQARQGGRERSNESIKSMGVSVSGLKFNHEPEFLFEQYQRPAWLLRAIDKINDKYGEYTITRGRFLGAAEEWVKDTVGFGRTRA